MKKFFTLNVLSWLIFGPAFSFAQTITVTPTTTITPSATALTPTPTPTRTATPTVSPTPKLALALFRDSNSTFGTLYYHTITSTGEGGIVWRLPSDGKFDRFQTQCSNNLASGSVDFAFRKSSSN